MVRLSAAWGPGREGRSAPRTAWGGAFVGHGWPSGEAGDEVGRQQAPRDQVESSGPEHREGAGEILGEAAILHLGEAPEAFDHMERMLPARPLLRSPPVDPALLPRQPMPRRRIPVQPVLPATRRPVVRCHVNFPRHSPSEVSYP